jgi:ribosomal protein S27E
MKTIYLKDSNQQILQEMQRAGFNVVTCGDCGAIILHRTGVDEVTCQECNLTNDITDCPDLYVVEGV